MEAWKEAYRDGLVDGDRKNPIGVAEGAAEDSDNGEYL